MEECRLDLTKVTRITEQTRERLPTKRKYRPKYMLVITFVSFLPVKGQFTKQKVNKEIVLNFQSLLNRNLFWQSLEYFVRSARIRLIQA